MDEGRARIGTWQKHRINILEDYRKIFGTDPPPMASLAFIDYIRVASQ